MVTPFWKSKPPNYLGLARRESLPAQCCAWAGDGLASGHRVNLLERCEYPTADLAMEAGDEIAQARLQQASTHWLRHTFATDLFDSGADVLSVRDLMDHASISTTSRYLHRPEERLRAELERLTRD